MRRSAVLAWVMSLFCVASLLPAQDPPGKTAAMLETNDFRQIVQAAKGKVFPSVVFIRVVSENYESGRKQNVEATGSGVLISNDGRVLTNWHVVDNATEIRCLLFDGRACKASVVGSDKDVDVALLQLDHKPDETFPFATIGDSAKLAEGDFVMAMGAPWGMSRSVSIGIISCTRRFLPEGSEYSLFLQTDASISPGNSGGPLVDTSGQVIGLNTRASLQGGDLGFAIPATTLKLMVPRLAEHHGGNWTYTGLILQPLRDFTRDMYFDGNEGVIVAQAEPGSPAAEAGVQTRDRLLRVNNTPLTALTDEDLPAVRQALALLPQDQPATLQIRRGDKEQTLTLNPRAKGKTRGDQHDFPRWDFTAATINQFDNPDLYFYRNKGVFIRGARQPGNAMQSGLQVNDILVRVGQSEVSSLDELETAHQKALGNVQADHKVLLTILRNGMMRQIVLDFSRDYSKE